MKGKRMHHHLFPAVAAVLLAAGLAGLSCTKGGGTGSRDTIRFSASLSSGTTRTGYSGEGTSSGGLLTQERIDWSDEDLIRIYSPEAAQSDGSTHTADYIVTAHETLPENTLVSRATISVAAGSEDLTWSTDESLNRFYAVYPSPGTENMPAGVSFTDGVLTGVITPEQTVTQKETGSTLYLPDMKQAYMLAYAESEPFATSVNLSFTPKFTAFEFVVSSGENLSVTLSSFSLTSTTGYLTGAYTIGTDGYAATATGIPDANVTGGGKEITVNFGTSGLTVVQGHPVSITVLALPQTVSGLTVGFTGNEIGARTLELKTVGTGGGPITFDPYKKHRIYNLSFPSLIEVVVADGILWDGVYASSAYTDNIAWDGVPAFDADTGHDPITWDPPVSNINHLGDPVNWTSDITCSGPFDDLYISRGYLGKTADGFAMTGDDQLEIIQYYGAADMTTLPRPYLQHSELPATAIGGFSVPTQAQWETIVGTARTGAVVNNVAGKHYAKVTVDLTGSPYETNPVGGSAIKGLLLFPDGAEFYCSGLTVFDTPADDFSDTIAYTTLQSLCGAHGCVFLPCAGQYAGSGWSAGGSEGLFWSGTASSGLDITGGSVSMNTGLTATDYNPVRLVSTFE